MCTDAIDGCMLFFKYGHVAEAPKSKHVCGINNTYTKISNVVAHHIFCMLSFLIFNTNSSFESFGHIRLNSVHTGGVY